MNYGIVGKHSSSFIYVKEGKNELLKGSHSPLSSNHLKISQADSNQQWVAIHFIQNSQDIFASIHIPPLGKKILIIPTAMAESAQCGPDCGTSNGILVNQLLKRLPTIRELWGVGTEINQREMWEDVRNANTPTTTTTTKRSL